MPTKKELLNKYKEALNKEWGFKNKLKKIKKVLGKPKPTPKQTKGLIIETKNYNNKSRKGTYTKISKYIAGRKTTISTRKTTNITQAKKLANKIAKEKYDSKGQIKPAWKEQSKLLRKAERKVQQKRKPIQPITPPKQPEKSKQEKLPSIKQKRTIKLKETTAETTTNNLNNTENIYRTLLEQTLEGYGKNKQKTIERIIKNQDYKEILKENIEVEIIAYGQDTNGEYYPILRINDVGKTLEELKKYNNLKGNSEGRGYNDKDSEPTHREEQLQKEYNTKGYVKLEGYGTIKKIEYKITLNGLK